MGAGGQERAVRREGDQRRGAQRRSIELTGTYNSNSYMNAPSTSAGGMLGRWSGGGEGGALANSTGMRGAR